jgi:hypothetical protein
VAKQILYVSLHQGLWEVRRFGRALAIAQAFDDALKAGRRLALAAAAAGIPAELRIARSSRSYEVEGVYAV